MPKEVKEFDVFISHNSVDKPWVLKLKEALMTHGLAVWVDENEIRPGDLFAHALEQGIENSKSVALIISPEAMESGWVQEEYYRALSLTKSKQHPLRLIPVVLRSANIPGFLSSRTWVDFRDDDIFDDSVKKLAWGITGTKQSDIVVVDMPFVVLAMKNYEAKELFEGKVFKKPSVAPADQLVFKSFVEELSKLADFDWQSRYKDIRESWIPFFDENRSIGEIVWEIAASISDKRLNSAIPSVLRPEFITEDFFSDQSDTRFKTWDRVSDEGCVLIIDAFSLFHPTLKATLQQSHLSSNERVALVIISPFDESRIPINQLIQTEISKIMERAFLRYAFKLDHLCEVGVGNARSFQRWLYSILPESAEIVQKKKPRPTNREIIRRTYGLPAGIDRLFLGKK